LRPNTYVELSFREPSEPTAVEIPSSALVSSGADRYVYVQHGVGRFEKRSVQAGWSRFNRVLVSQGLAPGDVVVAEGAALLDNQMALDN
jgi:Cu(I)/Ag(I) efflux system membrane fusion protein